VRIAIRVFLFILFLNGLLYCGWLSIELIISHTKAKNALSSLSASQQSELLKIRVSDLDKDESDEVWFNDELFDVVKRESIHDTMYVYVARDKDEQDVLESIFDHFRTDNHLLPAGSNKVSRIKNIHRAIDLQYIIKRHPLLFHPFIEMRSVIIKASSLLPAASEVLAPPPREIEPQEIQIV
jgi:hypothetical protein